MNSTSAYASLIPIGGHNVSPISFSNEEMMSYFNLGGDAVPLTPPHVATAVALMVGYYMMFVLSIHLIGHVRFYITKFLRSPPAYIVCASFVVVFSLFCNHLPAANASTDTIIFSTLFIWLCIFLEIIYVHLIKVHRSLAHDMVVADDNVVDNAGVPEVVVQYENFNNVGLGWRFFNFNWLFTLFGIAIVYYFSNSNNVVAELQVIIRLINWLFALWGNAIVYYFNNMVEELQVIIRLINWSFALWGNAIVYYFNNMVEELQSIIRLINWLFALWGNAIVYYFNNMVEELQSIIRLINWLFALWGNAIVYYFNNMVEELQSIIRLNNCLFALWGNAIVYYFNNMVEELQSIISLTKELNNFWDQALNYFDTIFVHIASFVSASHIAVIVFGIPIIYYFSNIYKPAAYVNTIMSSDYDSDYLPAETVNIFNQLFNQDDEEEAHEEEVVDFAAEHDLAVVEDEPVEVVVVAQQQEDTVVDMKKAKKLERTQKQLSSDLSNYWSITSPTRRRA